VADDLQHPGVSSNFYFPDVASANFILFPKVKVHLGQNTLTKATFKSTVPGNGLSGPSPPKHSPPPFTDRVKKNCFHISNEYVENSYEIKVAVSLTIPVKVELQMGK
jgi:hypothetical protein